MFRDRRDAGIRLAERLLSYREREGVLVLALPRGGAITGFEIARRLNVPLDVLIVRKISFPGQPELAIGAVSETGIVFLNQSIVDTYNVSEDYINDETSRQKREISRRVQLYRQGKGIKDLSDKTIILVDDGVATGATMKAAIDTLKRENIKKLVVALPVASLDTANELRKIVDEFICIETPVYFIAVGNYYYDFSQISDEEVKEILKVSVSENQSKDK